MHIVSAILRQYLLRREPVAVDGIGTLRTVRADALWGTQDRIAPPSDQLEFLPYETDASYLTFLVAQELELDHASAAELCRQWTAWAQSNNDGTMVMEGVGTVELAQGIFWPDPAMTDLLNPIPSEPMPLEKPIVAVPALEPEISSGETYPGDELPAEAFEEPIEVGYSAPEFEYIPQPEPVSEAVAPVAPARRTSGNIAPEGRNPHLYTFSFMALIIVIAALGYLCFYLWRNTTLVSQFFGG